MYRRGTRPTERNTTGRDCAMSRTRSAFAARLYAAVALVVALLLLTASAASAASALDGGDGMGGTGPGGVEVPDSPLGKGATSPLTAADRDFVARVRLAGLWEMPAGMMAVSKGSDPRVRQVGREIAAQHVILDRLTREAAAELGVRLPDRPTFEQQGWLNEMQRATGTDFDRVFVLRLRAAHGLIFPAIAAIRSGTHNDVVRRLAQEANQFVMTHLTLLESTGLVNYGHDVPTPPDPPPLHLTALAAVQPRTGAGGAPPGLIWGVLGLSVLAASGAAARVVRPR
jgi:putative membrane protein